MPTEVRRTFKSPLPRSPTPLSELYREVSETLMPYPMGNIHPRFWAWYMGASNFTGALADFLAAVQGSNLGGGNHAAARMDEQVVDWCKEMIGFPASASGTLVSGGSMANTVALIVARNVKAGDDVREHGVAAIERPLRFYASDQIHSCHRKAIEAMGLGNCALQRIPTGGDLRIDLDALGIAIGRDRAAGLQPACVIGNDGTVNTGAIDDLEALADLAARENLWFHVDGCIGASRRTMPIVFAAWSALIPSRSTRTSGCMRPSRLDASSFAMLRPIWQALRWTRNICKKLRAELRPPSGSMSMACRRAAGFAHSKFGWR
jgi:aromatic-L-amino-acid/L-tryptophan decarboxylase